MAQLSGLFRLGRDAELRHTNNGDPVVGLALAYNFYDKNADKNRGSQWVEASLWGKRAESLAQYLSKGGQVYAVIADLHIETYDGKNGTGTKLVGKITEIELAGGQKQESKPKPQGNTEHGKAKANAYQNDDDSDIPF